MSPTFFDLSHTIESGMITYEGFPAPLVCDYLSREASRSRYAPGTEFQIDRIDMVGNTGTYLDSPYHRYADGSDLADLPLRTLAGLETIVVDARSGRGRIVDESLLYGTDVRGKAVLVWTGWDVHWRTKEYFAGHPYLSAAAGEWLLDGGATLVGIDSLNIDCTDDGNRPVHSILLRAGIPIVEHLSGLQQLPARGATFFAVPAKIRSCGTFPVRAFATI